MGLLFFCLFGIVASISLFFDDDILLKLCGKSCGITQALIAIFGKDVAKTVIAAIWFVGAALFGWLAIRRK